MKDSEILRRVKKLIQSHEERYICTAIRRVCITQGQAQSWPLRHWVNTMLGTNSGSLEYWAFTKGLITREEYDLQPYYVKYKARLTRLAWLDWMITYCEKEEAAK